MYVYVNIYRHSDLGELLVCNSMLLTAFMSMLLPINAMNTKPKYSECAPSKVRTLKLI